MSWTCQGGVVVFTYSVWAQSFPALAASVNQTQAQMYFNIATMYLDNSATSPIIDTNIRSMILGLLTAHIATLFGTVNGSAPSTLVGRITNAAQGSVNVAVDMPDNPNAAWFNQTPFGAAAWQAMAPYRQALYIAAPQIPLAAQSYPGYLGYPFGTRWPL